MPIRHRPIVSLLALLVLMVAAGCALLPTRGPIGYTRSGGFAGYADTLVIGPDGSAVLTDRGVEARFTVPARTMAALDAAFAASDFRRIPDSAPPPGSADMFEYTFTWRDHTVHATEVPDELAAAASILGALVEDHRVR